MDLGLAANHAPGNLWVRASVAPQHALRLCFGSKPTFVLHTLLPSPCSPWALPIPKAGLSLIWVRPLPHLLRGPRLIRPWVCGSSGLRGPGENVSLTTVPPSLARSCHGKVSNK